MRRILRPLLRSPAFTITAVLTLALGISSTTAIFSVVASVLLHPLPFPEPERFVVPESKTIGTTNTWSIAYADFVDWRDAHVFAAVSVWSPAQMDFTSGGEAVRIDATGVGPEFFRALGVTAQRGRVLQTSDFEESAPRAVVISDRLWRSRFGARGDVVGSEIEINGIQRPIVGVLPAGAEWPLTSDLWAPIRIKSELDPDLTRRDNFVWQGVARLKPGATLASTEAQMALLAQRATAAHPDIRAHITTVPTPALEWLVGSSTPRALYMLLGAVCLLLLIGCVNVANLQLARATARRHQLAVHAALGAGRWRLARATLAESAVLAAAGCALGIVLAIWFVRLVVIVAPADVPRIASAGVDAEALLFAAGIATVVAALFGIAPAVMAAHSDPQAALAEAGTRTAGGRGGMRTRRGLVALELALSVVLLVGAGLAVRSIMRLRAVNVGFDPAHVLTASIKIPGAKYDTEAKTLALLAQLRDRLASTPGILAAGIGTANPLRAGGFYLGRNLVKEGGDLTPAGEVSITWNIITPGYFDALGLPVRRGRDFTAHDDSSSPPVIIVNESFAKAMFPGQEALGKRVMSSRDEKVWREIVGIVPDVRYESARDTTSKLVWVPYAQHNAWNLGFVTVRSAGAPLSVLPGVRAALASLDPTIALADARTMDQAMSRSMASDALIATLLAAFATMALVLAAVSIFGVLSYLVEQRAHEMGIRVALGATRANVVRLVLAETSRMVAVGLGAGLLAAAALTGVARSMIYGVAGIDPVIFGGVAGVLALVALTAAAVPARRAAAVDPMIALRCD